MVGIERSTNVFFPFHNSLHSYKIDIAWKGLALRVTGVFLSSNNFGKHYIAYMFTFISLAVQVSMRQSCDTAKCKTRWECNTSVVFIL